MENPEFSVNNLCDDLGMSRSQLYRKFESITGLTPNDFIRSVRLKRAAQLLRGSSYNISEISDRVGFNPLNISINTLKKSSDSLRRNIVRMVVERLNKKSLHSHLYTENALKRV